MTCKTWEHYAYWERVGPFYLPDFDIFSHAYSMIASSFIIDLIDLFENKCIFGVLC